jgi:mono/diheme cytochrome c family protein
LVHLPIGLIVLLGLLELLARSRRFKQANSNAGLILALAVPASLTSVICGWLLSLGGGYQENLLQWHKWTGIGTAAACLVAGLLYSLDLKKPYRWCLFSTIVALCVASHFGGSLTHGSDYLVRYAPAPFRSWFGGQPAAPAPPATAPQDFSQLQAFAGVVQPILKENCVACHGPDKSKGKLRLDSFQAALKGGDSGPVIVSGKSAESALLKRVRLPETDQDHMPPEGKTQPSEADIALIEWWIDAGAPETNKVADLKPSPAVARILATRFGAAPTAVAKTVAPKPLNEVSPLASKLTEDLGVAITALSPNEPWLQCNASVAGKNFGDAELGQLVPLGPNLRWLDLAGTKVTDTGLSQLKTMANLTRLHLERTIVTDAGMTNLTQLDGLEYLDLYGTEVTDAGLETLQTLPKLKQIYLWQTKVTPAAVTAFLDARTDKDQLQRWQDQIEQLKKNIRESHIAVELGTPLAATPATNAVPINTECPVSGKPVDITKTLLHEGALIAFCCDDCKAKFQQDPKPFLVKLAALMPKDSKPKSSQ